MREGDDWSIGYIFKAARMNSLFADRVRTFLWSCLFLADHHQPNQSPGSRPLTNLVFLPTNQVTYVGQLQRYYSPPHHAVKRLTKTSTRAKEKESLQVFRWHNIRLLYETDDTHMCYDPHIHRWQLDFTAPLHNSRSALFKTFRDWICLALQGRLYLCSPR